MDADSFEDTPVGGGPGTRPHIEHWNLRTLAYGNLDLEIDNYGPTWMVVHRLFQNQNQAVQVLTDSVERVIAAAVDAAEGYPRFRYSRRPTNEASFPAQSVKTRQEAQDRRKWATPAAYHPVGGHECDSNF